ncbi:hypothetical protein [Methanogenium cariaci]|uniref:sulfurtransferase TusA family protein n=1 Tax=Methanogenium cariaci TaxID=2197 RepID=UPI001FE0D30A|nr:hypothetical protein [Methanogenium cariaci]
MGNILATLSTGERMKVIAASQETLDDITMAVKSAGSTVVSQGTEGGERYYLIAEKAEKQEPSQPW